MEEKFIQCPYCRENISILLDTGIQGRVDIVDDCEVCCRPIEINYRVEEYVVIDLFYNSIEGN
ncbi:MAG: CPXCG motif-containing cysteine-rich protein, partial [Campylobacterota bacterium]|nr:CPXCG motif-containing cysteine-rich protein [Campylobacterota bacterium]